MPNNHKLQFYVRDGYGSSETADFHYPCFLLVTNNWDDYGYETTFRLNYYLSSSEHRVIGNVKILQRKRKGTQLDRVFTQLDTEFVSLGQEDTYYRNMREAFGESARTHLGRINDATVSASIFESFEAHEGFGASLIRFNDAALALEHGASILDGQPLSTDVQLDFSYGGYVADGVPPVNVRFNFDPDDELPTRLHAIIGRNGVGKTEFLGAMGRHLVPEREPGVPDEEARRFDPARPLFSRVIAVSFSAFDDFERPIPNDYFSYVYCGIRARADDKTLSQTELNARHLEFLSRIIDLNRTNAWEAHVSTILSFDEKVTFADYHRRLSDMVAGAKGARHHLSSGQSILVYFVSAALAYLRPRSLILFDEPETHLHPNAVASLIGTLHKLLEDFQSFAVVATHSPIVLQEVPRMCVHHFQREGDVTTDNALSPESFGESVSELTRMVFDTIELPEFFVQTFRRLARQYSLEEVHGLFDRRLGLNASAHLSRCFQEKDER